MFSIFELATDSLMTAGESRSIGLGSEYE